MKYAMFCDPDSGGAEYGGVGAGGAVRCHLCPHRCLVPVGGHGRCRTRVNHGGRLIAEGYGVFSALTLDPIEKKPLARFHPGSRILSAGGWGCNLSCRFCQNHRISQTGVPVFQFERGLNEDTFVSPEALVYTAAETVRDGNIGVAYTFNEPLVNIEYLLDAAPLVRDAGLVNVLVTNGFINPDPLEAILPFTNAMNIDLKAFNDDFYRTVCGGEREPVMETIRRSAGRCHVEVTTLIIPGCNSDPDEIASLASWLASVSPEIVLHLTRHHPDYLMRAPDPVKVADLESLVSLARRFLPTVIAGNI